MKTQFDNKVRVVAISNLRAMCEQISGTCHKFEVGAITGATVRVEYSNPDEYGNSQPVTAVYPCYGPDYENKSVVLDALRYIGCTGNNSEAWQAFDQLTDCEPLYRSGFDGPWRTHYEILVERNPGFKVTSTWDKHGCIQTWHSGSESFTSWRDAHAHAVKAMVDYEARVAHPVTA